MQIKHLEAIIAMSIGLIAIIFLLLIFINQYEKKIKNKSLKIKQLEDYIFMLESQNLEEIIERRYFMYSFILNMWIMKKVNETKVQSYVVKGYITQLEADVILATPQIN